MLVRGSRFTAWLRSGNFSGSRKKNTGLLLPTRSQLPCSVKRDPRTNMRNANNNWDFWTGLPEALHKLTYVLGNRGIPAGYGHLHLFGSNTYSFISADHNRYWVKFHLKPKKGIRTLTNTDEAA